MYSEQLETLIQSIIADGFITDKERAVLHKKAEAEGIDIDEVDVYVDGLIVNKEKVQDENLSKEHDTKIFSVKESSHRFEYYKLKKSYLCSTVCHTGQKGFGCDIRFTFVDVTTDLRNQENDEYREKFLGIGLLLSISAKGTRIFHKDTLKFSDGNDEILSLRYARSYNEFEKQDEKVIEQVGYKLDKETLYALCEAEDINMRINFPERWRSFSDYIILEGIHLPGFQYYAQYYYRIMFDPEAYPDAEKQLMKERQNNDSTRLEGQQAAQAAGILSRKIKGKRITPTPYYITQYKVLDAILTDVGGRLTFHKRNSDERMCLYLLSISKDGTDHAFYLCLTNKCIFNNIILSINLKDHILYSITYDEFHLSKKNRHDYNEHYRYYYIDNETLGALLTAEGAELKTCYSDGDVRDVFEIRSIPKNWKKAFQLLNQKDGLKKWSEAKGGFSKFIETHFHRPTLLTYTETFFHLLRKLSNL